MMLIQCLYCGYEFKTYVKPKCSECGETRLLKQIPPHSIINQYPEESPGITKESIKSLIESYKKNDLIINEEDAKNLLEKLYKLTEQGEAQWVDDMMD